METPGELEPFEGLAEKIVEMMQFKPPDHDNRVVPFEFTDEEIEAIYGKKPETTPEAPPGV